MKSKMIGIFATIAGIAGTILTNDGTCLVISAIGLYAAASKDQIFI